MYILALNGSHNNDGNTAFLLNEILRHCAEKGAETEICSGRQLSFGKGIISILRGRTGYDSNHQVMLSLPKNSK